MKKTRVFGLLVVFCIILSFFGSVYAEVWVTTSENNVKLTDKVDHIILDVEVTRGATGREPSSKFTVNVDCDGLYNIKVIGDHVENDYSLQGKELYYTLEDKDGREVRLAAYYEQTDGKYYTVSADNGDGSTGVDVLLYENQTYSIELSSYKAHAGAKEPSSSQYNPIFDLYLDANQTGTYKVFITRTSDGSGYYQSNKSAKEISNAGHYSGTSLEYVQNGGSAVKATISGKRGILEGIKEFVLSPFEETISELLLFIGDHFVFLINAVIGEDVTITKLVYNQVDSLNPNFFDKSITGQSISKDLREAISSWYDFFKMIAIALYILVLLVIGIHILLSSTTNGMSKAKELLVEWAKGIVILVFVPYVIKYAFLINESIVAMLANPNSPDYKVGGFNSGSDEWSVEKIEFRSPEYVSKYTGQITFGSDEATMYYVKNINAYEQNFDLMRIMRAYAGATKRFIYVLIWWILIGQLLAFIVMYYKRYFMIAFFIASFPIICIFNAVSMMQGKKGSEISSWFKEILTNIFMQMVQAIIYTVITSVCVGVIAKDILTSVGTDISTLNWLIIIIAINFVSEGEKLMKKIVGSIGSGSTVGGVGQSGQGIKGTFNKAKSNFNRLLSGKDEEKDDDEDKSDSSDE